MNDQQIAIIGCGRIAGHHCRAIRNTTGLRVAAVCDLVEEKAKAYGEEFSIPYFTNYHEMFASLPDISLVAILTPSGMHFEHGMEVLNKYGKHLVMDKPTFMKPSQVKESFDTAKSLGLHIFPVFQNRYNKAVQHVKKALSSGLLGEIRLMNVRVRWCRPQRYYDLAPWRGTYSHDGGALTNQGIHHVDLLRYLGGEVEKVNATMRTLGADIEVEDTVVASFTYKTDAVGSLEVTTAARPDDFEASLSIVGSEGLAQLGGIAVNELQVFTPDPDACPINSEDFTGCVYGFGHEALYRDISDFYREGTPYPIDEQDCMKTINLLHAFYLSDEKNNWVQGDVPEESPRLGRGNEEISNLYRTLLS